MSARFHQAVLLASVSVALGASGRVGAQPMQWVLPAIGFRTSAAMAYDAQRGLTVLFGGLFLGAATENPSGTWGWDGSRWVRLANAGPARRAQHSMAYDSRRGVIVLFGGQDVDSGSTPLGDTWEWNGSSWTQRATGGPSPRFGAAMAFDSRRGAMVLMGGSNNADTWEWDGVTWSLRATGGISPRTNAGMAFDEGRGVTVLFGGATTSDTQEWDGQAWTRVTVTGPPAASRNTLMYDWQRNAVVMVGTGGTVWKWDGSAWTSLGTAPGWTNQCAAYDIQRATIVEFGGDDSDGTVQEWNGTNWNHVLMVQPGSLWSPGMAYDSRRGVAVVFGGSPRGQGMSRLTWEWTPVGWNFRTDAGPAARYSAVMAYDDRRGVTVMYGGGGLSDHWEWDGSQWTQRTAVGPGGRNGHSMVFDSRRGVTVLFGGYSGGGSRNDTWEWDGNSWVLRDTPVAPAPQSNAAMAYDSGRGVTVLFGAISGDTWEWDGAHWELRSSVGPPPRSASAMAYDSRRGVCILCDGAWGSSTLSDTWEWDGNVWMLNPAPGLPPRTQHAMAYDSQRGVTVLYGYGYGTWELRPQCSPPVITVPPAPQAQCHAAGASFFVGASGALPLSYQWQIQTGPGSWEDLGLLPVHLPCGGSAQAFTPFGAQTEVRLSTCPGVTSYQVRCVVSNECGITSSPPAEDVVCYANCDCSRVAPVLNANDFLCFMASFAAGEPYANCDGSTSPPVLSVNDFSCFLARFVAGCP